MIHATNYAKYQTHNNCGWKAHRLDTVKMHGDLDTNKSIARLV